MKALVLALLLAAGAAPAGTVLNRGNDGEPLSLDPSFAGSQAEGKILGDLMVGLVAFDATGHPAPGIAQRWDISPDGLTWTFHLRQALWSDGSAVTAADFVFAWKRLLSPTTAARGASLIWIIKNAKAINGGAKPGDTLGAVATDPLTLTVTLEHPAPYLPELLATPGALPLPRAARTGATWARPGTYISDGPYLLKGWVPNDHITLEKNPRFYQASAVRIDTVHYFPAADTQAALRRLRAGELDMQTPLPAAQVSWMRANMPGALHIAAAQALAYLAINMRDPALADLRVRRALALIYDREAVAQKVMTLGEKPAYSYVPPGTTNYKDGPQLDFRTLPTTARLAQARRLMQDAGYGPFNRLRLTYAASTNPDSRRLAAVFQAMARQAGFDIQIRVAEYQQILRGMRDGQFQLGYSTWLADYDDAENFLDQLRAASPNNYPGYRNPKFEAAMTAAEHEADPTRRPALLKAAEKIALADLPWLPIRFLTQSEAVGPRVGGYIANARQINRSRWLWIK